MKWIIGLSIMVALGLPVYAGSGKQEDMSLTSGPTHAKKSRSAAATSDRIFLAAQDSLGKPMWHGYGLPNGRLGCAAALSNVLKQAGYPQAHSATVTVVRRQLLALTGAQEIIFKTSKEPLDVDKLAKWAKPGDVLLAFMDSPSKLNGGADAHCGIMDKDARIFTNDWNDGIWKNANYDLYFHFYKEVRLVRFN